MHIIFGQEQAEALSANYTVLEVDTFKFMPSETIANAYVIVENVPLDELPNLASQKELHKNLIENYRNQNWNFCEQAIEHLSGCFGKELDTFYAELQTRINNYKENDPGKEWDYLIRRVAPNPLQS